MSILDLIGAVLISAGVLFYIAGTIGLLRFPDCLTRLHALTKADNLGLGLVVLGVFLSAPGLAVAVKLLLAWGLTLFSSATACALIANAARRASSTADGSGHS